MASRFVPPPPPPKTHTPVPPPPPSQPVADGGNGDSGWIGRKRRRAEMEKGFKPKFYPQDERNPELEAMFNEATRDVKRQKAEHNRHVIYSIIVNYLNEFWRHEVELRAPSRYLSTVTGYANSPERQWWDDDNGDVAATTTAPTAPRSGGNSARHPLQPQQQQQQQQPQQPQQKTRWQEVAESYFTQRLRLDFNSEEPRHLRELVNLSNDSKTDPHTRRIIANYLSTL